MQEHQNSFVVEGTSAQVWSLWFGSIPTERSSDPFVIEMDNVRIEILHPGDAVHDGLVRHCRYPVPRYLLSGGTAESWELVTDVVVNQSYRYQAITKPPVRGGRRAANGSKTSAMAAPGCTFTSATRSPMGCFDRSWRAPCTG